MKKSAFLFYLIHSLSKAEKRFFKMQCALQSGDKKYLKVFDAMEKITEYDEEKLKNKIKDNKIKNGLSFYKNYLYNQLLKSLRHFKENKEPELFNLLIEADILAQKMLDIPCKARLEKALKLALRSHANAIAILILMRLARNSTRIKKKDIAQNVEEYYKKGTALMETLHDEFNNARLYHQLFIAKRIREPKATKTILNNLTPEIEFIKPPNSENFYACLYYFKTMAFLHALREDRQAANEFFKKVVDLWKQHPMLILENSHRYKIDAFNYLNNCHPLKKYTEYEEIVQALRMVPSKTPLEETATFSGSFHLELIYYLNTEQFEKANSELGLLVTYYSITKLFMQSHQWNLATEKLNMVMSKHEKAINKYPGLQANYNTLLASDMFVEGKVDMALDYIKENISIYQKLSDSSNVMKTYMNIGFAHASINNPDSAFFYLKKSQDYITVLDDKRQEVKILISMMSMLYSKQYSARILNLLGYKNRNAYFAAIREKLDEITDPDLQLHFLRQKIMYHEKHQEKSAMIKTLEEESDYLYELRNLDTTNLQLLQYQLDLQLAENESLTLQKANVENQNRILSLSLEKKKQQQLLYAGIFGAIVLFIMGSWYYANRLQKERYAKELAARKAEEAGQKLTEAEKALLELKKLIL